MQKQNMAQIQAMNPPPPPKTPRSPSHHSSQPRFGGRGLEDVPDERKLYVLFTFSYAVSEAEMREFFAKSYGNVCQIQALFMNESHALIVFYSESAVRWIVGDAYDVALSINGKDVMALRSGPKPTPPPSPPQPRFGGWGPEDVPAERKRRGWDGVPDDRRLSVLFYSEYAVSEAEIREFFAKSYGNACQIQKLFMTKSYAVIVFYSDSVQLIVGDANMMKFSINGKNVLALRFGPSTPPSPSPSPSLQYSQPRGGEDVPDDRKLFVPKTPWSPSHRSSQPRFGG